MKKKLLASVITGFFLMGMVGAANALTLFADNFETDLSAWTGKFGGAHHGQIVADPLGGANSVLNFTALNAAGDIFSTSTAFSTTSGNYILSFDYLGLDSGPGVDGNLGGFIGHSIGLPGSHTWLAGTVLAGGALSDILVDNGAWGHYNISFAASTTTGIHLMLEDWSGSGGISGDAYFDNILLADANGATAPVPEPSTMLLLGSGLIGLIGYNYRRGKQTV